MNSALDDDTNADLFPYQREGVRWLTGRDRALLAWEQGLGKTATSLRAARARRVKSVVVVCPAVARINWLRERDRWAPELRLAAYSYDEISRAGLDRVAEKHIDLLILDESHYLKETSSARTKLIYGRLAQGGLSFYKEPRLIDRADIVWCLSGTPTPNHVGEIYPMARALFPESVTTIGAASQPASYNNLVSYYCYTRPPLYGNKPIVVQHRKDKIGELKAKLALHVNRLRKSAVLHELPPIQASVVTVEAEMAAINKEVKRLAKEQPAVAEALRAMETTGQLTIDSPHLATLRRLTGEIKAPLVAQLVDEVLENGTGKVIVFAQHRSVIGALQAALSSRGVVVLDGTTNQQNRQRAIDVFQSDPDCRVFVGQLQAAGTAITLTAASDVFFAEASWVPAENSQAAARAHRIGQKEHVFVRFVSLAGSVDEAVMRVNARKIGNLKSFWEIQDEVHC